SEHRRVPLSKLRSWEHELGLYGAITCLDETGKPMVASTARQEDPAPVTDQGTVSASLTSMRHYCSSNTQGHVLIGGRLTHFAGTIPGVIEEAIIGLEARKPLFLAGGFGGATLELLRVICPSD